jgi:branched-chain amino acid aminotransferase
MNVFFVIEDTVVTPAFNGNILHGVTRDSALTLLREKGYKVEERPVTVEEVVAAARSGRMREVFGTGTAATIAHITAIGYHEERLELPSVETREISNWLMDTLDGVRRGRIEDTHGWIVRVDE